MVCSISGKPPSDSLFVILTWVRDTSFAAGSLLHGMVLDAIDNSRWQVPVKAGWSIAACVQLCHHTLEIEKQ